MPMPSKLSHIEKLEIVRLHESGWKNCAISKKMKISRHVVARLINAYVTGSFSTTQESEKKTTAFASISSEDLNTIKETLRNDCTKSARDVKQVLADGKTVCMTTVRKALSAAGFTASKPRYCQLIRNANKEKRVDFCNTLIAENEQFDDVIFTDESTIQLHGNKSVTYRQFNDAATKIARPKHPLKLHVWAGISRRGATRIAVFEGIMRADFYTENILQNVLTPFVREKFPDSHRFMQDNDHKHTSRLAKQYMEDNQINWWKWPAESCDLNPIEMAWSILKPHVSKKNPTTKQELMDSIVQCWEDNMTTEMCNALIDHIFKVVPVVVLCQGHATADLPNKIFPERSRGKSIEYFSTKLQDDNVRRRAEQLLARDDLHV